MTMRSTHKGVKTDMDTEITLDLNKPLFSYSRYEINDQGYGDDFIHRDGDGVNMQVFFDRATG